MPPPVFLLPITTGFYDFDPAQIANNGAYIRWLELARGEWLAQGPWPLMRCMEAGIAPVLTRTAIDYRAPLRLGEPVQVVLKVAGAGASVWRLSLTVSSPATGTVFAQAEQSGCFMRLVDGRPIRMPADLRRWMEPG